MFLSIVIPIYKVEPYITRCLNSCLQQTKLILGKDYEIIAVDDGSPDNSGKITDELLADKHGCTVIHQENKGLSEARNAGLHIAQGEYVWYVDSDDWIETDAVSQLKTIANDSDRPDVIMIRSRIENEHGPQNVAVATSATPPLRADSSSAERVIPRLNVTFSIVLKI